MQPFVDTECDAASFKASRAPIPPTSRLDVAYFINTHGYPEKALASLLQGVVISDRIVPGSSLAARMALTTLPPEEGDLNKPVLSVGFNHDSYYHIVNSNLPAKPITLVYHPESFFPRMEAARTLTFCGRKSSRKQSEMCANYQTLLLSNYNLDDFDFINTFPSLSIALEQAKKNLQTMAWVGVADKWTEGTCLLYYTFGWAPPVGNQIPLMSDADFEGKSSSPSFSRLDMAWADIQLYRFASGIFDKRFAQMKYEVRFSQRSRDRVRADVWTLDCFKMAAGSCNVTSLQYAAPEFPTADHRGRNDDN